MNPNDGWYLTSLIGSWLICYGLFAFVFLDEAIKIHSGKPRFYITDIWAVMLGLLPAIRIVSLFIEMRTGIFRWLFVAGMIFCQGVGMIWFRLIVGTHQGPAPQRLKNAGLVLLGALFGAIANAGVYVATMILSVFLWAALDFALLVFLIVYLIARKFEYPRGVSADK